MPRSFAFSNTFEALPVEVICQVLENLEMHDLLACSTVSKHLRKVVKHSSRLQYIVELERARMVSLLPQSASLPFASRLNLLRERENNWKYMNWTKRHTLSLPPTGSVYEFVGGLYGNGREDDSRVTASISFLELPSSDATLLGEPQKELKTWTHTMGDVNIIDFTMDPSQDLLVLVALAPPESKHVYELHLRSIQSNQPHHKAQIPILPCWLKPPTPVQSSDLVAAVRVQVAGNLVALLIKEIQEGTAAHLEIWNWETNPQFSCAMTRQSGIDDFTFLTHDTFLLVRPAGRFEVYTFEDPQKGQTKPVLRVMYSFPPLSPGYMYWYISMSSNPAPGYVPRPRESGPELGNKRQLYYPRPEERIHACCLYIFNPASEENASVHSFVFFLNLQTLLNPPTEWIAQTQAMIAARSASSKRSHGRSPNMDIPANVDSTPMAGSSSSSPISVDIPIHGPPSQNFPELDDSAPFIPPQLSDDEDIRRSPPYPLFPTFDDYRPAPGSRQAPRVHLPKYTEPKPVPRSSRRAHLATSSLKSIPPSTEIPWEVWGPQSTRWFEECLSTDWQHAIYGLRTVESVNPYHNRSNLPAIVNTHPPAPPPGTANDLKVPATSAASFSAGNISASFTSPMQTNGNNGNAGASSSSAGPSTSSQSMSQSTSTQSQISNNNGEDMQGEEPAGEPDGDGDGGNDNGPYQQKRYLRVRDFNPYSFTEDGGALVDSHTHPGTRHWRQPRLVTEASTTAVKGVFTKDIVSSLPYMEIVSREAFEVTDVMMDDCRLLLLKRGQAGKLKRVEVLMM
ncbi:hypothetical protein BJ912DRAFT_667788 [Pholiota molesta]|nr:hypothetical protein BJ912DRAFT_667788 [Pholiota molesta]